MVHKPLFKASCTGIDGTGTGNPLAQARIQNLKTHKTMTMENDITVLTVEMDWEFKDTHHQGCQEQFIEYLKEVAKTENFDAFTLKYTKQ